MTSKHDITESKAFMKMIRLQLSEKVTAAVEDMKRNAAANLLLEADPKPRVEIDYKGNPIIPSPADYAQYFQNMQMAHIQAQWTAAHQRWANAQAKAHAANLHAQTNKSASNVSAARHADAELKALRGEIAAAQKVMQVKSNTVKKKRSVRNKGINKQINSIAKGLSGGSPLVGHIVNHVGKALFHSEE